MRSILVTFSYISDADKLFEHDLGALNRRVERAGLLSNLGPYCKALCARRDFAIRRQLIKNDKVVIRAVVLILQLFVSVLLILSFLSDTFNYATCFSSGPNQAVLYYTGGRQ